MIKKIEILIVLMFLSLIILTTSSYAAVEVKAGASPYVNTTLSNAFTICYDLRANSSTLGNNSLDPHLSLQEDWGIIAYLAASTYGSNGVVSTIGTTTTGNESGVKDLGKTATYVPLVGTASRPTDYLGFNDKIVTYRNTKYVDLFSDGNDLNAKRGWATGEVTDFQSHGTWEYWNGSSGQGRKGPFGAADGSSGGPMGSSYYSWYGKASGSVTFRPAIWN